MDFVAIYRRDRRVEAAVRWALRLVQLAFVGAWIWTVMVQKRVDAIYTPLYVFPAITGVLVFLRVKAAEVPRFARALRDPDPAVRAGARRALEALRDEALPGLLVAAGEHPTAARVGSISADEVADLVERLGGTDWRRVARIGAAVWSALLVATVVLLAVVPGGD